ncbi:hypothetical protein [Stenotrophomonas pavanii]|uniref:hypothetical protein n=1 Tax=Stenotrophomonas pavanii TaxID=487698 RepID=UPI0039C5AEE5
MIDIEQRITAAIERITSGNAPMRVPADETDPDLVLADCLAEIRRLRAALAARQPVGEPVAYTSEAQLNAVRVSGDGIMSQRNAKWRIPLYTAPPAQAVDLGQFRTKVAELLRSEFDLEVADPEDHRHDDGSGEADRIAGKIVALLDSQAVGNG